MKTKFCVFLSSLFMLSLFAERGIVVTMNDKYAKTYFLGSIAYLRNGLNCTLPVEIWHDGDELSQEVKNQLRQFSNITFCDFQEVFGGVYGSLRGWHGKPFMLIGTRFNEICLMDADVYFLENPEKLFAHPKYVATGAFFFRDRKTAFPSNIGPTFSLEHYLKRRAMFHFYIPSPSSYIPEPFLSIWHNRIPTLESPNLGDFQEAGCLLIDKQMHLQGIFTTIELTLNRNYVYDCVLGDKETYWMGLEISKEPYAFNDTIPCFAHSKNGCNSMIHFVDHKLFYQQKQPFLPDNSLAFEGINDDNTRWARKANVEELATLQAVYTFYKRYH